MILGTMSFFGWIFLLFGWILGLGFGSEARVKAKRGRNLQKALWVVTGMYSHCWTKGGLTFVCVYPIIHPIFFESPFSE